MAELQREGKLTQVDIIIGCWGSGVTPHLIPEQREKGDYTHSVIIIDACRPYHWRERFSETVEASLESKKKAIEKWVELLGF